MLVDLDMIVEADTALRPFGIGEWFCWQLFELRVIKLIEQVLTAGTQMPGVAGIQHVQAFSDSFIQLSQ